MSALAQRESEGPRSSGMIRYENMAFDYEPFPIGLARPAIEPGLYRELVETFPTLEDFRSKEEKGVKYSLSAHNNRRRYFAHLKRNPAWQRFYDFVKSPDFIAGAFEMLRGHNIDLGIGDTSLAERMTQRVKAWRKGAPLPHFPKLSARFEFSAMPVTGGSIRPHTDNPSKVITMVVAILEQDEWDEEALGGGTSIVWPKDRKRAFNQMNGYLDFDEVDCVRTFPFQPNQCLCFIKTYNSWHAVWPMTGQDPTKLRRTLTINIESS